MDISNAFLRKVKPEDIDILYAWAMDQDVRKNAFSTGGFSFSEHKKWFAEKLVSNDTYWYIYECGHTEAGQVRVDVKGDKGYIDYSIDRRYRALGHGKNMLLLLERKLEEDHCDIKALVSQVKGNNIASRAAFEHLGFREKYVEYQKEIDCPRGER